MYKQISICYCGTKILKKIFSKSSNFSADRHATALAARRVRLVSPRGFKSFLECAIASSTNLLSELILQPYRKYSNYSNMEEMERPRGAIYAVGGDPLSTSHRGKGLYG